MTKVYEGELTIKEAKIAIVVSRFNEFITKSLLSGAVNTLIRHGLPKENIEIFWVPGAFEIPLTAQRLAQSNRYNGIITLGAVIKGETPHFEQVSSAVATGVAKVNLEANIPVIFGVISTNTVEQALNRAGIKMGNKGSEAAVVAIEMVNLLRKILVFSKD
jgi:6,7-dimethyl-8-ribityllumazine synthase